MFRAVAFAVLLSFLAAPSLAQTPIWPEIQLRGWTYLGDGSGKKWYFKPAPASAEFKRVWLRTEFLTADIAQNYSYRSRAVLMEVDCPQQRSRLVQATLYAESNLGGDHTDPRLDQAWAFAVPDTAGDHAQRVVCTK
jgi:hypothetical protein